MKARPYIAVSGVASPTDVALLLSLAKEFPALTRRLVGAVLVSRKTLGGQRVESLRYPSLADAQVLCAALAQSVVTPAVHYNSRTNGGDLLAELVALANAVPAMRMLQLNIICPAVEVVEEFRRLHPWVEIVLQVSGETRAQYADAGLNPWAVLADYGRVVDHLLLDLSRGAGRPLPVEATADEIRLHELQAETRHVGLGVAGGLGPDARPVLGVLHGILDEAVFARLSFDAESNLRVPASHDFHLPGRDVLDAEKVRGYLQTFEGLP